MIKLKKYAGFLFVGDPHLWSKKPGKRLDLDFTSVVLDKIEQAVDIAIEKNLYLIFLGDLFHSQDEADIELFTRLCRILKKLPEACATVCGNHEKREDCLSDNVALTMFREAGVIKTLEKNEIAIELKIGDLTVYVGSTPYGRKVPKEIKVDTNNGFVIWLTHHNFDFGECYPGVVPIEEIVGVSLLINGHIHKTKKPVTIGNMVAFNPGNITRLSKDCADHVPAVWSWIPKFGKEIEAIPLKFKKGVFNLIGEQIEVDEPTQVVADELTPKQISRFVEKMEQDLLKDEDKNDDGDYLKESIVALGKAMNTGNEFIDEMLAISEEILSSNQ